MQVALQLLSQLFPYLAHDSAPPYSPTPANVDQMPKTDKGPARTLQLVKLCLLPQVLAYVAKWGKFTKTPKTDKGVPI